MSCKSFFLVVLLSVAVAVMQTTAKEPQRLRVGLVLGGGGAKGAAEVGALRVIEQSGIPIDYICGTSIGSIVGGLYAVGYRSADIEQMFLSQEWASLLGDRNDEYRKKFYVKEDGVTYILGFPVGRRGSKLADSSVGALRGDHIVSLIDSMLTRKNPHYADSLSFDQLPTPFRCVAVDMLSHEEYVFTDGKLSTALRASMAIPGAFKAVTLDTLELVDGGMLNNLPVDVVRAMGADVVIAVDLTQNKHEERDFSLKEKFGIGGLLDWVVSRPDLKKYNQNVRDADVYINPNLKGYSPGSFREKAIRDMMTRGEKAAKKQSNELKKLRRRVQNAKK